jgi:hypothetical protein
MDLRLQCREKILDGGAGSGGSGPPAGRPDPADADRFERLLERALRIDVPEHRTVAEPSRAAPAWRHWALAAAVVLAVGLTFTALRDAAFFGSADLASDVMAHVHHEPAALVRTTEAVSVDDMDRVLQAAGARLPRLGDPVTYIKLCPFRGHMVAHLAVQGRHGPVTVLLLPDENIDAPMPIEEDGFVGTIVPLETVGGSLAVVGEHAGDIDAIKDQVADAVRWRL